MFSCNYIQTKSKIGIITVNVNMIFTKYSNTGTWNKKKFKMT